MPRSEDPLAVSELLAFDRAGEFGLTLSTRIKARAISATLNV